MSQGLIGGVLWGVLTAGFGLAVASQVASPPGSVAVATAVPAAQDVEAGKPAVVAAPAVRMDTGTVAPKVPPKPAEVVAAAPVTAAPKPAPEVLTKAETSQPNVAVAEPDPVAEPEVAVADPAAADPDIATARKPAATDAEDAPKIAVTAPDTGQPKVVAKAGEPAVEAGAASGPKFVAAPKPAAPVPAASATPPAVVTAAPSAMAAALPQAGGAPLRPASAAAPAAVHRPAAVVAAGPPPAPPGRPALAPAPTVVATEAPRAAAPAAVAENGVPAPLVTARAGFQPGLISAPAAPLSDAPPATGALPPPPPLTPDELAIAAKSGAGAADPALPEVIVLSETADPAAPTILKKPKPLAPTPSLAAKGQVPSAERLPKIAPAADTAPEPAAAPPVDAPPIERFARTFENAAGKPLFAVVLIDTGDPQIDRASLAAMPFPVTFALDPSAPESALAASIYRAAGQEVVMLATGLPAEATAADVEVSFGAHEAALPEAVAVLDPETGGFQGDRPLSTLVVPVVKGQGRGLLSWDRGLNAADQVARREGLRSGVIFRRLDGEGEPVAQMRRYLDRAAFKAAQDGRVIVAGETRPNTVAALLEWAVEGRASTVALAPLSAALRVE